MEKDASVYVKRQHYLPRFYLEGFANQSGRLFSVRRENFRNPRPIKQISISNIGVENNLYEIIAEHSPNGYIERNSTERWLSNAENYFAPRIQQLINADLYAGDTFPENGPELIGTAIVFAANLFVRNPKILLEQRRKSPEVTDRLLHSDFFTSEDLGILAQMGYDKDINSVVESAIQHAELCMLDVDGSSMQQIISSLMNMNLSLLKAPFGAYFISASFPLLVLGESAHDTDILSVYLPLSASSAILFTKTNGERLLECRHLSAGNVILLNKHLIKLNDLWDYIFSPDERSLLALTHSCAREWSES